MSEIKDGDPVLEDVESRAQLAMDHALTIFGNCGIALERRPVVHFSDQPFPFDETAAGMAKVDVESFGESNFRFLSVMIRTMYGRLGLSLSDAAITEVLKVAGVENSKLLGQFNLSYGAVDIVLFPPILDELENMGFIMAHELWHLVEEQFGLLGDKMFAEATATYVGYLVANIDPGDPVIQNFNDVIYGYGALIVRQEVASFGSPLAALLNPEVRGRIYVRIINEVRPMFEQKVVETYDPSVSEASQRKAFQEHPDYAVFRENPSAETLLQALRNRGYIIMADEFARQDMTHALEYSKRLLF